SFFQALDWGWESCFLFCSLNVSRHTWPISFGSGAGLGMAYANCQNDLRSHYLLHRGEKVINEG
uniref:MICOS complex subunit MIC10 n=1 Tax=Seriola lalandi dorsalis TaxID=1841481 RepID=A0A3B4XJE3_SERLL